MKSKNVVDFETNNHSKPKVLVVAYRNLYLNKTDDVFYEALSKIFDLHFYGPGYVPFDQLKESMVEVFETIGPFDACIIHQYITHNLPPDPNRTIETNSQYFYFDRKRFHQQFPRFAYDYKDIPCDKFLMSLRTDCYAFTEKEEQEFMEFKGHLIVPPPQCIAPVVKQFDIEKEDFEIKSSDRFIDYCANEKHRIIPVPHIISPREFAFRPFKKRPYTVSVPGAPYYTRLNAIEVLKEQGYEPKHQIYLQELMSRVCSKFDLTPLYASKYGLKFMHWAFKNLLSNSKVSYTDGSRAMHPIRKYFEIPTFGSLLAADPFYNTKALGFINNETYIQCDPKTIPDVVDKACRDVDWAQTIIANSAELIRRSHSVPAWSKRMRGIYDKIKKGSFKGAHWEDGEVLY